MGVALGDLGSVLAFFMQIVLLNSDKALPIRTYINHIFKEFVILDNCTRSSLCVLYEPVCTGCDNVDTCLDVSKAFEM